METTTKSKLTLAPQNNRLHGTGRKGTGLTPKFVALTEKGSIYR